MTAPESNADTIGRKMLAAGFDPFRPHDEFMVNVRY
jgi:hypothetical protein